MNKVVLIGRLTKDPETRTSQNGLKVCRYTLAVDRRGKDNGADFISCVAFGKSGEFAENYLRKGTKIAVTGRLQTGSYEGKNGKVYTTDVVIDDQEFCESKKAESAAQTMDDFLTVPDDMAEELPFN